MNPSSAGAACAHVQNNKPSIPASALQTATPHAADWNRHVSPAAWFQKREMRDSHNSSMSVFKTT